MTTLSKKIFALWDSVDEMAADLGESPNVLRRARDLGHLPDPRHDRAISLRARALGKRISLRVISEARLIRPAIGLSARQALIRDFYSAAGGYQAVSERTGTSRPHLYANATRGFLNRSRRFEYRRLAEEIRFDLPDEIFSRP